MFYTWFTPRVCGKYSNQYSRCKSSKRFCVGSRKFNKMFDEISPDCLKTYKLWKTTSRRLLPKVESTQMELVYISGLITTKTCVESIREYGEKQWNWSWLINNKTTLRCGKNPDCVNRRRGGIVSPPPPSPPQRLFPDDGRRLDQITMILVSFTLRTDENR